MYPFRRLAAILAADVAGYSRLIGQDEEGTIAALRAVMRQRRPNLQSRQSRRLTERETGLLAVVRAVVLAMLLPAYTLSAAAESFVTDLPLSDGGMQRLLYTAPANPRAALVMLPGSNGMVEIGQDGTIRRLGQNFLLRTMPLWQEQGLAVAVMTPPNGMSLLGQRHTPAYAAVMGQAVDFVRARAQVPVWLVGTSQGATAAVNGGARLGDKVAGIVVASSVTGRNSSGETLFDSDPGNVQVPVLIVANSGDLCPASPPGDAPQIAAALTSARRKEIVYMQSTATEGPPCEAKAPHGFSRSRRRR